MCAVFTKNTRNQFLPNKKNVDGERNTNQKKVKLA